MKPKLECWKCGKTSHFKRDCRSGNKKNANAGGSGKGSKDHSQDQGIIHETTAPYTPQQNGVAERKNRALKEMVNYMLSYSGLSEGAVVRLPDLKRKTLAEKGIDCIFVGYAEHTMEFWFYVIEPNDSVSINLILESRDAIFDENRFSLILRPNDIILKSDKSQRGDHSDDVPSEIHEPRKETYNEAMHLRDYAFGKMQLAMKIGSIMEINNMGLLDLPLVVNLEEVYMKQPEGFVMPGNEHKVCKLVKSLYGLEIANLCSGIKKFSLKDMEKADSYPWGTALASNNRVFKTERYYELLSFIYMGYLSVLEGYLDASWINHVEDSSSMSGWVFLLGGGAISWASKKQTCITGSTMESEFVALAAAGKEAEWLRNLIHKIHI
ncbi:zinc finger, CCHC-type containing protein [Tanacetum coccineum]|uniref:Zinc finger, CCHC-type containing protein n=1 Tax=Tanacetum coccineum TaxID=301880 RepID=A0ABQ4Z616_9ASTR